MLVPIERVGVVIDHPHGPMRMPLAEWMRVGPGPRSRLEPVAAFDVLDDRPLSLRVVPRAYRNDAVSRVLIAVGLLRRPSTW